VHIKIIKGILYDKKKSLCYDYLLKKYKGEKDKIERYIRKGKYR
jgi:hypothetical protein